MEVQYSVIKDFLFIILTCLSYFCLAPKADGSLGWHDSVLLCFCLRVPFGPGVHLVRVLRSPFSTGTSWPFKTLCGHSQKQLVVCYRCFYSSFPNSCFFLLSSVFPLFIKSLWKADCSQPWQGSLCKSHSTEPGGRPPAAPATAGEASLQQVAASPGMGLCRLSQCTCSFS